jgi:hypothetical protein
MNFIKAHKLGTIIVAIVVVLFIVILSIFGYANGVRKDGINKETALSAQYAQNQNVLSNYINQFDESLGISDRAASKVNDIILAAVQGRYKDTSATPGSGGLFSAISEAYPDLTATTASYAKVQDLVESGRNDFKDNQTLLLDRIRDYKSWENNDLIRSFFVNSFGFPTNNLKASIGNDSVYGQAALDRMDKIILNSGAISSYQSGTTGPLISPQG